MRSMFVFGLTLLVVSGAAGAEKPIPQDLAKMEKHRREWLEWNRRTTVGAYDKVGKKDPKWDKPAREALELAARMFCSHVYSAGSYAEIRKAARAAIDAGCDDPLVVNLYNRSLGGNRYPATREMKESAKALGTSRYPAFRRAHALAASVAEDESSTKAEVDAALALLPESLASDERNEFWEDRWRKAFDNLITAYRKRGLAAPAAYERVDAKLAKVPELKVLRLQLRGFFWLHYGWEARTQAFAPDVPAEGAAAFEKRLIEARKALDEAWRLRPDSRTAEYRMEIEKGIGGGDRQAMELWFDRAMTADGDNRQACWSKLDWLTPKWYGTPEEMLAFGKACRDTKNWWAGITLLDCDAHYRFSAMIDPNQRSDYVKAPEVWSEISSIYDEYLKHQGTDDVARTKYATLCYLSRHYAEATEQFQAVGDRLAPWTEFPYIPLPALREIREDSARLAKVWAEQAKIRADHEAREKAANRR